MKNPQQNQDNDPMPSNKLAHLIISSLFTPNNNQQPHNLTQLLKMLKNKKNPSHEKFSNHIERQMNDKKIELHCVAEALKFLGESIKTANNNPYQVKSITSGMKKYFAKAFQKQNISSKEKKDFVLKLIQNYFQINSYLSNIVCQMISQVLDKLPEEFTNVCEKQIYNQLIEFIKGNILNQANSLKCCLIIRQMDLYKYFKFQELANIASLTNLNQNINFFKNKEGKVIKELAEAFIAKQTQKDYKATKKLIDDLSLNAFEYPEFIKVLTKRSLRYFLNQQPIFSVEMKIKGRPEIIQNLIQILIDQNRKKQALHFINRYYVKKFYHLNPEGDRTYKKNILEKHDEFKPTEEIIGKVAPNSKFNVGNFLNLSHLKYKEQQIIFVNDANLDRQILDNILYSPCFGIDCELGPAFNCYEPKILEIIQIAINYQRMEAERDEPIRIKAVYIFDFPKLRQNNQFVQWLLKELSSSYKGQIVGHTVKEDFLKLIRQLNNKQQENIQMDKLKFVDVANLFKGKFNQTKCSLEYICTKVLDKRLSKFQQCSGWHNRPLRRAQLHYAALDAVLPLEIYSKLK